MDEANQIKLLESYNILLSIKKSINTLKIIKLKVVPAASVQSLEALNIYI